MRQRLAAVCTSLLLFSAGCSLEGITEHGEICPPPDMEGEVFGAYMSDDGFCEPNNLCIPVGTTSDFICTNQCGANAQDKPEGLAFCAIKCIETFEDANIAVCNLEDDFPQCKTGFANCDGKILTGCEVNLNSMDHCGGCDVRCITQSVPHSAAVTCKDMRCIATQCEPNHHLINGGECTPDPKDACTNPDTEEVINCTRSGHAIDGICDSGECQFTKCEAGFHLSAHQTGNACVENTDDACGNDLSEIIDCTDLLHAIHPYCNVLEGHCDFDACEAGYHPTREHTCRKDSIWECGNNLTECPDPEFGHATRVAGQCGIACDLCYHDAGGFCEADSFEKCGEMVDGAFLDCSTVSIENATRIDCVSAQCQAVECNNGYHVYDGACEVHSLENCGEHDNPCPNDHCTRSIFANQENYINNQAFCISESLTIGPSATTVTMNELIYAGSINAPYPENGNRKLSSLTFPKLQQLSNTFTFLSGAENVKYCSILIRYAHALTQINIPMLKNASGTILLENLESLATIQLDELVQCGEFYFNNLPNLTQLSVPKLEHLNGFIGDALKSMTALSFPAIQSIGWFWMSVNTLLTSVNVNNAPISSLIIVNNPVLSCANMCSLKNYTGDPRIENNKETSCDLKSTCQ